MLPFVALGAWRVGTYGLLATLGLLASGTLVAHRLLCLDLPRRVILGGFVLTILAGLAGTILMSFLITSYRVARDGLFAQPEGFSVVWALSAGALVAIVYIRLHRQSVGRVLDLVALPIPLGLAIGRLGCLAAGCCYGRPTDSWPGMYLPDASGLWAMRYPTQLMAAIANLCIFLALVAAERYGRRHAGPGRTWPFDGFLLFLALILYSSKRFVLAFLRESGPPLLGPLSWMHLNALIVLLGSLGLMAWNLSRAAGRLPARRGPQSAPVGE
jgi:phosphatidylglycerol:prolipoprotein diacylglycerol transferase